MTPVPKPLFSIAAGSFLAAMAFAPETGHAQSAADSDGAYLEIVVYDVADPANFGPLRFETEALAFEAMPGLIWWRHLSGDGNTQADILAWETPEQAKAASELMQNDARFAPFVSAISGIGHFGHYWADTSAESIAASLSEAPLIEIALYSVQDATVHTPIHGLVHERLSARDDMLGGARLTADEEENGFGDLLTWSSKEAHESAGQAMMGQADLAPFFGGMNPPHVFALFSTVSSPE